MSFPSKTPSGILVFNYEFPPLGGGAGNATQFICRELAHQGLDVAVVTSGFRGLPRIEKKDGYTVHRVKTMRRFLDRCSPVEMAVYVLSASLFAFKLVRCRRPAAVVAFFGIPCGPIAWLIKFFYKIPYIIALRGGDVPGFLSYDLAAYHRVLKPLIKFLWRKADRVTAVSRGLKNLANATDPFLPIKIIPNGVDSNIFRPKEMSSPKGRLKLLFAGRLSRQKGVDLLISALRLLDPALKVDVDIAGDGPERKALEILSRESRFSGSIEFHGWCSKDRLAELYRQADIFVLPSRDEGMSNVLLEALASGLPVVATKIAGNDEVIFTGRNGLLITPESPQALADAISRVCTNMDLRMSLAKNCRQDAEKKYSWSESAESYHRLVTGLIKPETGVPSSQAGLVG